MGNNQILWPYGYGILTSMEGGITADYTPSRIWA